MTDAVRPEVEHLVALGPLPAEGSVPPEQIDEFYRRLRAIERPVHPQEVALLLSLFGPDDCFGVAWTLLHLVETAGDQAYFVGLLESLPELAQRSPEWTRSMFGRVFNSDGAFEVLSSEVDRVSPDQSAALAEILNWLDDENRQRFGPKARLLRQRLVGD